MKSKSRKVSKPRVGPATRSGDLAVEARTDERLRERFGFTPRQAAVAEALADGLSYAEIAGKLAISPLTVHTHVKAIHEKAGVDSSRKFGALVHSLLSEKP